MINEKEEISKGYEPGTWTESSIETAKRRGWTEIIIHTEDDGYQSPAGTVTGIDPDGIGRWYIPKHDFITVAL